MDSDTSFAELRAVWFSRWQAVEDAINEVKKDADISDELRVRSARVLLDRLGSFAQDHFFFFFDGLRGESDPPVHSSHQLEPLHQAYLLRLLPQYKIPYRIEGFIFRTILNQVMSDLLAIERSIGQWLTPAHSAKMAPLTKTWQQVDPLIERSLAPFRGYVKDYAVMLATSERSAFARCHPYAPVALLGVPFTAAYVARDYLMTPHEVAHFIFWNGQKDSSYFYSHLERAFLSKPELHPSVLSWAEEIFADVLSVLIAGPVMALSIQDIMLDAIGSAFDFDNGTHPIPRIRPYIHLYVLSKMRNMETIHGQLSTRWQRLESARPTYLSVGIASLQQPSAMRAFPYLWQLVKSYEFKKIAEVQEQVESVVDLILDFFPGHLTEGGQVWIQEQDCNRLYAAFDDFFAQTEQAESRGPALSAFLSEPTWDKEYRWTSQVQRRVSHPFKVSTEPIQYHDWLEILAFEGWTTGGGTGNVPKRFERRRLLQRP
jgi:hypothetical protein